MTSRSDHAIYSDVGAANEQGSARNCGRGARTSQAPRLARQCSGVAELHRASCHPLIRSEAGDPARGVQSGFGCKGCDDTNTCGCGALPHSQRPRPDEWRRIRTKRRRFAPRPAANDIDVSDAKARNRSEKNGCRRQANRSLQKLNAPSAVIVTDATHASELLRLRRCVLDDPNS